MIEKRRVRARSNVKHRIVHIIECGLVIQTMKRNCVAPFVSLKCLKANGWARGGAGESSPVLSRNMNLILCWLLKVARPFQTLYYCQCMGSKRDPKFTNHRHAT